MKKGEMSAGTRAAKIRIWKNVIVISVGFLLQFMPHISISALQSSINAEGDLGTHSLTVIYIGVVISSLFLVPFAIKHLTFKWTIVVCNLCNLGYILAQFCPNFYTMVPSALLVGLATAPQWSAMGTYISVLGKRYSELCEQMRATGSEPGRTPSAVAMFYGVFFATFQSAGIWGNLITSAVLSMGDANSRHKIVDVSMCGANFCEEFEEDIENLHRPQEWKIRMIMGIFLGISLFSASLVAVFLEPLSCFESEEKEEQPSKNTKFLLMSTLKQMVEPRQALLAIIIFYNGFERGFLDADFTKAYVGCIWGIQHIGHVLMVSGAANSIMSVLCGKVVKYTGRMPLFGVAYVINVIGLIFLLLWTPHGHEIADLYVMSAILSLSDALWGTQINGLQGLIFEDNLEAAFSAYKVCESFGYIAAYFASPLLCADEKLYSMFGILTAGILGYFGMEYLHRKRLGNDETSLMLKP